MHRCLRPHALPARARCVPNFLTLNRPSFTKWRPISPWRSYTTAVEENRSNYTAQLPSSYAPKENEKNAELETSSGSQNKAQDDGDAFDFILEGYEKKLTNVVKEREEKKKRRVRGTFASHDMHIREKRQTPRRAGRPSPTEKAKRPPALHKSGQPLKYYKTRFHRSMRLEHALTKAPRAPALWARPRLVSVATMGQYSPYALNRVWNYNYARAQNEFDSRQSNRTATVLPPLLDPHAAEWVDLVLQRMESGNDLNLKGFATTHGMEESAVWSHVALWMLHYDRDSLVEFLLATGRSSAPGPWVADCLQVLAAHYVQLGGAETAQQISKLVQIFTALADNPTGKGAMFDGRFVRMVLPHSTTAQMLDLHKAIRVGEFKVHANTLMHLTSYLAKNDHFHQALDVLLDAHRNGASTATYQFRSNCSTLLRKTMNLPGGLRVCLRIVDNLVKIGVRLNTRLCNIIILNAVEAGDKKTAKDIHQSLLDHKMKPDKYTYALLLKACKLDIDDADALNQTITNTIEAFDITTEPVIAVEILHCLAMHHTRKSGEQAWSTICQAYAQIFELNALEGLGLPIPSDVQNTPREKKPMAPPTQAIGIMLRTYLHLTRDGHGSNVAAQKIYQRYRALVSNRIEPFASLGKSTHCYNAFLGTFTKNKRTLVNAAEVIKDMQNASAESRPLAVAPDVQSWSIFLEGFTRHGQLKLAEQVLTYMRGKGLEPNSVTWNTLLAGYASQQDFEGMVGAMRRLDASGHAWDEWTYNGLRRFRNTEQLKGVMERRGNSLHLDFTDDLKQGLGARLSKETVG
jgi:pentatricopeptide repeat protein